MIVRCFESFNGWLLIFLRIYTSNAEIGVAEHDPNIRSHYLAPREMHTPKNSNIVKDRNTKRYASILVGLSTFRKQQANLADNPMD